MTRPLALLLLAAALVRLVPILAADRVTADVLRYRKVAAHVLDVSWNPSKRRLLYPYPPYIHSYSSFSSIHHFFTLHFLKSYIILNSLSSLLPLPLFHKLPFFLLFTFDHHSMFHTPLNHPYIPYP
jgi:hypothetical protein